MYIFKSPDSPALIFSLIVFGSITLLSIIGAVALIYQRQKAVKLYMTCFLLMTLGLSVTIFLVYDAKVTHTDIKSNNTAQITGILTFETTNRYSNSRSLTIDDNLTLLLDDDISQPDIAEGNTYTIIYYTNSKYVKSIKKE